MKISCAIMSSFADLCSFLSLSLYLLLFSSSKLSDESVRLLYKLHAFLRSGAFRGNNESKLSDEDSATFQNYLFGLLNDMSNATFAKDTYVNLLIVLNNLHFINHILVIVYLIIWFGMYDPCACWRLEACE